MGCTAHPRTLVSNICIHGDRVWPGPLEDVVFVEVSASSRAPPRRELPPTRGEEYELKRNNSDILARHRRNGIYRGTNRTTGWLMTVTCWVGMTWCEVRSTVTIKQLVRKEGMNKTSWRGGGTKGQNGDNLRMLFRKPRREMEHAAN